MAILKGAKKLENEELQNVNGGTIVDYVDEWGDEYYVVVNEHRNGLRLSAQETLEEAQAVARMSKVSDELITADEFQARYGYRIKG